MLYTVTYTIADEKGKRSRFRLHTESTLHNAIDDNEMLFIRDYFVELAVRLAPLVRGAIVGCSVTLEVDVGLIKPSAETGSDVEEAALFLINDYIRFTVPTFDHDEFSEGEAFFNVFGMSSELESFISFLLQPEDDTNWPSEHGGITDNRGVRPEWFKSVRRVFRSSRA